jgi:hypothetical protein
LCAAHAAHLPSDLMWKHLYKLGSNQN